MFIHGKRHLGYYLALGSEMDTSRFIRHLETEVITILTWIVKMKSSECEI